ncbi:MAG: archaeosortase/exosortase family protein, partial [Parahaliea sp.]
MVSSAEFVRAGTREQHPWLLASVCVAVYWLAVLWLFRDTALSLEATWARSNTYAHGYLILPIFIWLVY